MPTSIGYPLSAPAGTAEVLAPAPAAEAPAPAAAEAPAPAIETPRTPTRFDLLQISRSLRRDLLAQKRRLRDAQQPERGELPETILERAKQRAAASAFEDTVASHTPQTLSMGPPGIWDGLPALSCLAGVLPRAASCGSQVRGRAAGCQFWTNEADKLLKQNGFSDDSDASPGARRGAPSTA